MIACEETGEKIITLIQADFSLILKEMAERLGISQKGIEWQIQQPKKMEWLKHIDSAKGGHGKVIGRNDDWQAG